mgnify:CR=1 FL=1
MLQHLDAFDGQLHADAILLGFVRRYSPRVPAREASAILEGPLLDQAALGIADSELRLLGRPGAIHQ